MDHHTVAVVSLTGTCLDVLGSLYLDRTRVSLFEQPREGIGTPSEAGGFSSSCRPVNSNLDDEVLTSDLVPTSPVLGQAVDVLEACKRQKHPDRVLSVRETVQLSE